MGYLYIASGFSIRLQVGRARVGDVSIISIHAHGLLENREVTLNKAFFFYNKSCMEETLNKAFFFLQ